MEAARYTRNRRIVMNVQFYIYIKSTVSDNSKVYIIIYASWARYMIGFAVSDAPLFQLATQTMRLTLVVAIGAGL